MNIFNILFPKTIFTTNNKYLKINTNIYIESTFVRRCRTIIIFKNLLVKNCNSTKLNYYFRFNIHIQFHNKCIKTICLEKYFLHNFHEFIIKLNMNNLCLKDGFSCMTRLAFFSKCSQMKTLNLNTFSI